MIGQSLLYTTLRCSDLTEEMYSGVKHTALRESQRYHTNLLVRGKHLNAIAFTIDCKIYDGTVDGDQFYMCVHKYLLPHLMPFDGVNAHSVVIMDNASIHHVDEVIKMIQGVGAMVLFLPPYAPGYNPSILKHW